MIFIKIAILALQPESGPSKAQYFWGLNNKLQICCIYYYKNYDQKLS